MRRYDVALLYSHPFCYSLVPEDDVASCAIALCYIKLGL